MYCRILSVLAAIFVVISSARSGADDKPAGDLKKGAVVKRADARGILEAGQEANSLPAGLVVRASANLNRVASATRRHGAGAEKTFKEIWEFASNRVDRMVDVPGENAANSTLHRAESIPLDSAGICKDLLDGGILRIGEAEKGERQNFIDTDYDTGHRSIEIFLNGKSVLFVGESCLVAGYAESDARAFASLYENLAKRARSAFAAKSRP